VSVEFGFPIALLASSQHLDHAANFGISSLPARFWSEDDAKLISRGEKSYGQLCDAALEPTPGTLVPGERAVLPWSQHAWR
jgi:hypothetical protein